MGLKTFCTDLLVSMDEHHPQVGGFEFASCYHVHIVAFTDVVDVDGDAGVCADAVLLHERDELGLGEEVGRARLPLPQLHLQHRRTPVSSLTTFQLATTFTFVLFCC